MCMYILLLLVFSCFLQNLLKKQERMGREVEEEVDLRMRKAEREEKSYTEQLHSVQANMQVRVKINQQRTEKSQCYNFGICWQP